MTDVESNKLAQSQVRFSRTTEVENSDGNFENIQVITTDVFTEDCTEMNTTSLMIIIILWSFPIPGDNWLSRSVLFLILIK